MQNVFLITHLIIALCLIAVVLLQRSEGGALGMGGGGGGLVSARGAATALSKLTWGLAAAFLLTSIALTIIAGGPDEGSVFDALGAGSNGDIPLPEVGEELLPPAAEQPATPASPATPPAAD